MDPKYPTFPPWLMHINKHQQLASYLGEQDCSRPLTRHTGFLTPLSCQHWGQQPHHSTVHAIGFMEHTAGTATHPGRTELISTQLFHYLSI